MKKKIIVFGNTEYSYMIAKYIEKSCGDKIATFTVDEKYMNESYLHEFPVIPFEKVESCYAPEDVEFIIGVGYKAMNAIRESVFKRIKGKGYRIGTFIHPDAIVETSDIGEGNIILSGAYIGKGSKIGTANIFWNQCNISHDVTIGDFNYFAPSATFGGFVNIKNKCFFGLGCIVKHGLSIAQSTLIGAGAYVDKNTEEYDVYVPSRSLKLKKKSTDMNI